jgi:hypothetical protein
MFPAFITKLTSSSQVVITGIYQRNAIKQLFDSNIAGCPQQIVDNVSAAPNEATSRRLSPAWRRPTDAMTPFIALTSRYISRQASLTCASYVKLWCCPDVFHFERHWQNVAKR